MTQPLRMEGYLHLYHHGYGFSVIPVGKDKKPLVEWKQYQEQRPSWEQVESWFIKPGPERRPNIAVVCGKASGGVAALDFETEAGCKEFFKETRKIMGATTVTKSPHGGIHVWLRETEEVPRRSVRISREPPLDLLGEGGYFLAPPSRIDHSLCDRAKCTKEGVTEYEVVSFDLRILRLTKIYEYTIRRCRELGWQANGKRFEVDEVVAGVPEGRRNQSAFAYARHLIFTVGLDPETAWYELERWNRNNKPPMEGGELRSIWESAQRYPFVKREKVAVPLAEGEII